LLIGVMGKARSGKSITAERLVDEHGFRRTAFAETLKVTAQLIFNLTHEQCYGKRKMCWIKD